MIKNNNKAKELVASSKQMLEDVENEILQSDAHACESIEKYIRLREEVLEQSLKRFDEAYLNIQNPNFKGADLTQLDDTMEDIKMRLQEKLPPIEPLDIPEINTAFSSSLFLGLFSALGILAVLLFIGAQATGIALNLNALPTQEQYESLLQFYGNLLLPNRGNIQEGLIFILLLPLSVGLILALSRYYKRSRYNLNHAQAIFQAASAQHLEKSAQNKKIMTLCQYTQKLDETLGTLQVYLDEYIATMRRILRTEGEDFSQYALSSRKKIETAVLLYKTTRSLMITDVVGDEGVPNEESRLRLDAAIQRLDERFNDDQR